MKSRTGAILTAAVAVLLCAAAAAAAVVVASVVHLIWLLLAIFATGAAL